MIKSWILAFRLKTLTAAIVPILVAWGLVQLQGLQWQPLWLVCLFISALSIQIATNLFNDAIDFKKGADHNRVGPVRVTQSGLIGVNTVLMIAVAFCFLATLFGFPLVMKGGWPFLLIGVSSLFLAYGYTGGPFPLAYLGLGDFFVLLYFGLIAVAGSAFILAGQWSGESLYLGLQIGCLSTVLIAVNNLRDQPTDAQVGKKTLAVRFGERFVMYEILTLMGLSYVMMGYWIIRYHNFYFLGYFLTLPLAFRILKTVFTAKQKSDLISCLGQSALLQIFFAVSFFVASWL